MAKPEGFDFRPANDNEMSQVVQLGNYVFAEPPSEDTPPPLLEPGWTQCAFHGQQLAAVSGAFPFIVRLNSKTAQIQGVTLVGTEPAYRRRGLVRQLITDLLHRGKEAGEVASILLASRGAIYQRFGYGLASTGASYDFDPREAQFQTAHAPTGRLQRMGKEEAYPLITQIFKSYAKSRNLMALRADQTWGRFLRDLEKDKAYCIVHFDDNEEADGYCIYSTVWEPGADQQMTITDFAYTSMAAYRSIWHCLTTHDLVRRVKWSNVPEDDPAPGILLEPRCLNRKTSDGIWMRVIDVARLLEARHYDVDGDIVLKIEADDICPWNNGTYQLSARNGLGKVQALDGVDAHVDAQIVCSINELASLASGHSSASWLHQIGRIKVQDESQLGYHDQLFATRHRPTLSFGF